VLSLFRKKFSRLWDDNVGWNENGRILLRSSGYAQDDSAEEIRSFNSFAGNRFAF